ncbi:OmpA-like transmembrane domain-containing protein [Desulfocapsa sulfexigens DSM 10523]|uniref:OmpA-like transmembrane domain-containing protein n=1 Tax=Desulfocapsa sulfexigens (strain DSM 10523 / SB164P1) TaxID=1167006 RepID=M1PL82_DESSD|nr:outer membrane beta-barrel protein [Desulfocapsa sulfexigens]AGF77246.1 OmpA-like transmembrane domain-containing protein [Desulfocapsa sulfexigens DSM 10523]
MKTKTIITIATTLLSVSTLAVALEEAPSVKGTDAFYMGISAGTSYGRDVCDGLLTCDDSDTGFKVYGGYQFTPVWGVEAFYTDLGEFTGSSLVSVYPQFLSVSANASASGMGAVATASWPIGDSFALFSKLGFLYWSVESSASGGGYAVSIDDDGFGLALGLGARYSFTDNFGVRAGWDWYTVGDDSTTGESDVDLFSAGIFVSF